MKKTISMTQARRILGKENGEDPTNINNDKVLQSNRFIVIDRPDEGNNSSSWKLQLVQ